MKILAIHNFHRKGSASGDDQVYKSETALLEAHGHTVVRYTASNDEFDNAGAVGKALSTFGMLWSFKHYKAIRKLIKQEKPDVVHVHTFFPLLSPSILYAAKRSGVPVVATLHDTRFVCPCSTSLRGTQLCNKCGDGRYFRMCRYGCFKGSRAQSFIVAGIFKYHRIRKSFYKQIDKYICLNDNQIRLLKKIGFDGSKIVKKYNFVPDAEASSKAMKNDDLPKRYAVFYGRIGEEKGVRILMKIWDKPQMKDIPLVVMGGGPLEDEFCAWAEKKENVYFLGYTQHDTCLSIVKGGEFVVFPSIWYEGCSMVEIEAESLGKALIATDLGFSAEAVQNGVNGYKVPLNDVDGFTETIADLWKDPQKCKKLGENARADYESKYLPEDNYSRLIGIYERVIRKAGGKKK
ncbi:MAG: glycosyltransferase family 4 protein [Lachnospiraceae bacterium]|nr:glycosyltransferase family 4 protein [Lachnospiraceae bacterium]